MCHVIPNLPIAHLYHRPDLIQSTLTVFIVSAFIFASCTDAPATSDLEIYGDDAYGHLLYDGEAIPPTPQEQTERIFLEPVIDSLRVFGVSPEKANENTSKELILYELRQAIVDRNEEFLYLLDHGALEVKKFDIASGELAQRFGKGEGAGPGEFGAPVEMALLPDGRLWVNDAKNHEVTLFDASGEVLESNKVVFQADGPATVGKDRYVLSTSQTNGRDLFQLFNRDGKSIQSFGRLVSDEHPGHGFIGNIVDEGSSNTWLFIGFYGGGTLRFTKEGKLTYFRETIDHDPFPRWVGNTLDQSTNKNTHIAGNVWGGKYYVRAANRENDWTLFNDVYALESGDYLHSFTLTENCFAYFFTDRHVYASCKDAGFVQFRRPAQESK